MQEEDVDYRKVPKTRRRFVFEPRHIEPNMFVFGEECTFLHIDHRMIRDRILSLLEDEDCFSVAQTCWYLHDDCQIVLRERAQTKHKLDDPLILQIMKKYSTEVQTGWGKGQMQIRAVMDKNDAKKFFCLDDADMNMVDQTTLSYYARRRRKSSRIWFEVVDIAKQSIERHGSLGCMQNYAARVVRNRERTKERRALHEDRKKELVDKLKEEEIDWEDFIYCDTKAVAEKWIENGTKTNSKKLVVQIKEAMKRQEELRMKLGETKWEEVSEQKTCQSFVDGRRNLKDTLKMLDTMLKRRREKEEEKEVKKKLKLEFVEEAKKVAGEGDFTNHPLAKAVESGKKDKKEALKMFMKERDEMKKRKDKVDEWMKERGLNKDNVTLDVISIYVETGKLNAWKAMQTEVIQSLFTGFLFLPNITKEMLRTDASDFQTKVKEIKERYKLVSSSEKLMKYLTSYRVQYEAKARISSYVISGEMEEWMKLAISRFDKFDQQKNDAFWAYRNAFADYFLSSDPEATFKEPVQQAQPYHSQHWHAHWN